MNRLFEKLLSKNEKVAIIGLGYVGLPLAIEMAKSYDVIGFDINKEKLNHYRNGIDVTEEVGNEEIQNTTMKFTDDEKELQSCKFQIVSVPTPINSDKTPNLEPIISASKMIGRNLTKGTIVVYESTVYPGTTEEVCIPILEKYSELKFGKDFTVGYSPERINPGDKINTLTKIIKVVSGSDDETLKVLSAVYNEIITAGVYEAESIKVAEAAKVIENSQRDINIAFMNELAVVFNKMNIDTNAVLKAAGTKWNFLKFTPGLVGGHCIGVDPYYFIYKAEQLGYHSQIISAGRKINDDMGNFIAKNIIKQLIRAKQPVHKSKVAVLGISFKENCPDVRNTKVVDIIKELEDYGVQVIVHDPIADKKDVKKTYDIDLVCREDLNNVNAVVIAVNHDEFQSEYDAETIAKMYGRNDKVLIDIKSMFTRKEIESKGFTYWSL